jgi:hypothetical protein
MTDIRQQIDTQLEAYSSLDALKTAVREWFKTSDGSLDALTTALSTYHNRGYDLNSNDWQELQDQDLTFKTDDAATREDKCRLQRYWETGYGISHEQVAAWLNSVGTDRELPCPK